MLPAELKCSISIFCFWIQNISASAQKKNPHHTSIQMHSIQNLKLKMSTLKCKQLEFVVYFVESCSYIIPEVSEYSNLEKAIIWMFFAEECRRDMKPFHSLILNTRLYLKLQKLENIDFQTLNFWKVCKRLPYFSSKANRFSVQVSSSPVVSNPALNCLFGDFEN